MGLHCISSQDVGGSGYSCPPFHGRGAFPAPPATFGMRQVWKKHTAQAEFIFFRANGISMNSRAISMPRAAAPAAVSPYLRSFPADCPLASEAS